MAMEQQIFNSALDLWGPVGGLIAMVMIGGYMSLKWLATRDDARNTKMIEMIERISTIAEGCKVALVNNTAAMHEMKDASDRMVAELGNMRESVTRQPIQTRVIRMNGSSRV